MHMSKRWFHLGNYRIRVIPFVRYSANIGSPPPPILAVTSVYQTRVQFLYLATIRIPLNRWEYECVHIVLVILFLVLYEFGSLKGTVGLHALPIPLTLPPRVFWRDLNFHCCCSRPRVYCLSLYGRWACSFKVSILIPLSAVNAKHSGSCCEWPNDQINSFPIVNFVSCVGCWLFAIVTDTDFE